MTSSAAHPVKALAFVALGLLTAGMAFYVANTDDAPGAAVLGFLILLAAVGLGVKAARGRLPAWAARTALAAGIVAAAFAAFLTHAVAITAPLFAESPEMPSASESARPPQQWTAAVERARPMVRAAIMAQNLPGVSIAVGSGAGVVWAEGFGWRDVVTETPVTPDTRFNIGTAAQVVAPAAVASLGLTNTGADAATEWSPEHVGEPEEDFPGFTAVHDLILRPMGISAPRQPLPGDRATFYVPTTFWHDTSTDPRRGRRLMAMRDLACCTDGMAFYSTPSDLVRFALATTAASVNGELAGGSVMSLVTRPANGLAVAVTSNIAHADTAALAAQVADVFSEQR